MTDQTEKMKELFENKELLKEILSISEPEEAQKWF
jgi:hypothetical protein